MSEDRLAELTARLDALETELEEMRDTAEGIDEWANGIFAVLLFLMPHLLKTHPALSEAAMKSWEASEDEFERGRRGEYVEKHLHYYEPAKILARVCRLLGVPSPSGRSALPDRYPFRPGDEDRQRSPSRGPRKK